MPAPDAMSTARTVRGPTRRWSSDAPDESTVNHAIEPRPTPARSGKGLSAPAVEAAENTAAHERIVIGFDAVAASDVAKARCGDATSVFASPPRRMRNALHSVRNPTAASTIAPTTPSVTRNGSIASNPRLQRRRAPRRACPRRPRRTDREAAWETEAHRRAQTEQPDRPDARRDQKPEPEARGERSVHIPRIRLGFADDSAAAYGARVRDRGDRR